MIYLRPEAGVIGGQKVLKLRLDEIVLCVTDLFQYFCQELKIP